MQAETKKQCWQIQSQLWYPLSDANTKKAGSVNWDMLAFQARCRARWRLRGMPGTNGRIVDLQRRQVGAVLAPVKRGSV